MYVIGKSKYDFVRLFEATMYDGKNTRNEIKSLGYGTPLNVATIFPNYDDAFKSLREIQSRVDDIRFSNYDILGELWDKEHQFDKVAYSKELTIYQLIPTEVDK